MSEVDERMNPLQQAKDALFSADLQFRLASAVRLASTFDLQPLDVPVVWAHGKHTVKYPQIALRQDQGKFAAWCLQRTSTYMLAVCAMEAIRHAVDDPLNSSDSVVTSAYQISRLIRNAFAHGAFDPIWEIDAKFQGQTYEVPDIIKLDTSGLQGKPFDWRDYGGPLALLRLPHFVRSEILGEKIDERTVLPLSQKIYYQSGDLILQRIPEAKEAE